MELQWVIPGKNKVDDEIKNPSLLFEKFLSVKNFENDTKREGIQKLIKNDSKRFLTLNPSSEYVKAYQQKMQNLEIGLSESGYKVKTYTYKSVSPFIIGMGSPSALENGLTFNRNWGLPTIPSSAIKGVIRNYIEFYGTEEEKKKVEKYLGSDDDEHPKSGEVNFLSAYMLETGKNVYVTDIINNHFQPYYGAEDKEEELLKNPPNDWYNPNPVFFISLSKGLNFNFTIVGKDEEVIEEVSEWLQRALKEIGVGAKTAVGYGRFTLDKAKTDKVRTQREKAALASLKRTAKDLEKMTPFERKVYEIEMIEDATKKFNLSLELFNKIDSLESEEEKKKYAMAVKKIWQGMENKWIGKLSKKQVAKVKKIKDILKEE